MSPRSRRAGLRIRSAIGKRRRAVSGQRSAFSRRGDRENGVGWMRQAAEIKKAVSDQRSAVSLLSGAFLLIASLLSALPSALAQNSMGIAPGISAAPGGGGANLSSYNGAINVAGGQNQNG